MTRQPLTVNRQDTMHRAARGSAGFSYVAILLSLQMITVVGLIALPKLGSYMAAYRLIGAADQLSFEINRVRMQAVGQNKNVRILMLNSTQYARQVSSNGTDWTTERTTTLPGNLIAYPTGGRIQFDKRGMASANSTLLLTNGPQWKVLATNVLGRVTLWTVG